MTSVQWLLQSNHPNPSAIREIELILRRQGHDVHSTELRGYSDAAFDIGSLDMDIPVVCYGPSFVPRALRYPELSPGIFFDPATFRWSAFRNGWGELMVSANADVVTVSHAASRLGTGSVFVRPDEDSKAFNGGLFDRASLELTIDAAIRKGRIGGDTLVVVAEPVQIDAEWRTFVVGGQVVASSSYRKDGTGNVDQHVPHEVVGLAEAAAARWTPAEVFCLDIALAGDRYGIVEANCFNASRFYGADANVILGAVSSFAGEAYAPRTRPFGGQVSSP